MEVQRGRSQALFLLLSARTRGNGPKVKCGRFPLIIRREIVFHCEDDEALTYVAERGCGLFICGNIQKLSGHKPEQGAWVALLKHKSWTKWPQKSLPTSAML